MRNRLRAAVSALIFTGVVSLPLVATPITGEANITGNVNVSASTINFNGTFQTPIGGNETGSFGGLTSGTIKNLTGGPVTGTVNVPAFMIFTGGVASPITFDLTSILPGFGTLGECLSDTVGNECTPTGSPFTIIQGAANTLFVDLTLIGNGYTGTSGSGTSVTKGAFSTQSTFNGTITQLLGQLEGGGTISQSYSATFTPMVTPTIPEPASLVLMGVGLLGAGMAARKTFRRR